jgi:hypothetical protein
MHRIYRSSYLLLTALATWSTATLSAENPTAFPEDPDQKLERTCFQTSSSWSENGNLRSDVAIVYGIGSDLTNRIQTWRNRGYRIHLMTGVSWGNYQDYLYGRFDGVNHEDEAQTDRKGDKVSHGGDVYYMCPGTNYGKFLAAGVQRALDAGVEAVHLEEPEFWVRSGYSEAFKREWKAFYGEDWQPPHSSVDAQWRASRLKYFLYRRALQQVFDHVQDFNRRIGRKVSCYVPTHSLLNYAQWSIVSPESSLARLSGCDGYIAQVWTGTSRTPNYFRGQFRERTFETAFLEYGAMQNLVRSTGRRVWYLNDPIEDNPNHDWEDYRRNWECTLVASLFQPEVSHFEVAPWPERIFSRKYPRRARPEDRKAIPPSYATELQTVMNALNDMGQKRIEWDCGTTGIGVLISDSLMFQRGDPAPSDLHLGHFYGLAMPLLKRGMPVSPVQLENVTIPHYLDSFRLLLLSYDGQKPLTPEVHTSLADWVKHGGSLMIVDDDKDPFNGVREWWNADGRKFATPREHLFEQLGLPPKTNLVDGELTRVGKGSLLWLHKNPAELAAKEDGDQQVLAAARKAADQAKLKWRETNYLLLRRGPYLIAAGLDESVPGDPRELRGSFVNLLDPELKVINSIKLLPGSRFLLMDLPASHAGKPSLVASACKALPTARSRGQLEWTVEGVGNTPAVLLLHAPASPRTVTLDGTPLESHEYSASNRLLWIRFQNKSSPRELRVSF